MKSLFYLGLAVLMVVTSAVPVIAVSVDRESSFSCTSVTEIPQVECEALLALYQNTRGDNWMNNINWLVTNTPSNWYGVSVESAHVKGLYLSDRHGFWGNHLSGILPPELGNLTFLTDLDLKMNELYGSIPPELGRLTNLNTLFLSANYSISGKIPPELGNLASLTYLDLSQNQLTGGLPLELGDLTNLTYLRLSDNQLTGGLPAELGNLTSLTDLRLSNNQLTGGLPPELGKLSRLIWLHLSGNQLSGSIPPELGNLTNLSFLDLSFNTLSGSIPPKLGNLTGLMGLYLDRNRLSGAIPAEFGNLARAWTIDLSRNQLSGSIPAELGNLPVWDLNLSNNQLSGSIPAEFGNLAGAWTIDLSRNQLSGSIPPELGNLVYLFSLVLSHNQLSGSIPSELSNITGINSLQLSDNLLEGDIPPSFINLEWDCDPSLCNIGGLDFDYNLLNVPAGYPDPNNPWQVFLNQIDPDWHLLQGFTQVIGAGGGEIISSDGKTDILIPDGALIGDTSFTYKPWSEPLHGVGWLAFGHNLFELTATDTYSNPVTIFSSPITATLSYTTTDLYGVLENTLGLYYWDGPSGMWKDGVTTCSTGAYQHNLAENTFQLSLCHLTEFGVFGIPERIFLPDIWR